MAAHICERMCDLSDSPSKSTHDSRSNSCVRTKPKAVADRRRDQSIRESQYTRAERSQLNNGGGRREELIRRPKERQPLCILFGILPNSEARPFRSETSSESSLSAYNRSGVAPFQGTDEIRLMWVTLNLRYVTTINL